MHLWATVSSEAERQRFRARPDWHQSVSSGDTHAGHTVQPVLSGAGPGTWYRMMVVGSCSVSYQWVTVWVAVWLRERRRADMLAEGPQKQCLGRLEVDELNHGLHASKLCVLAARCVPVWSRFR